VTSGRTALVLSGGLGTRLRGVIGERQKVVSEPGGRVFLARVLDDLAAQGIGHAVLCAGYRSDEVEALARSYTKMRVSVSVEPEPRGTAGALGYAFAQLPELRAAGAVLVLNGDTFCETDVSSIFATHARTGADVTVVLARVPEAARYGGVETAADGRVLAFLEKGASGPGWVNAGVYVLSGAALDLLPADQSASLERDVLPRVGALYATRAGRRFLDIGVPEDYARVDAFFSEPSPPIGAGRFVLLDRDGTLNREVEHLRDPDAVDLLPGVPRALRLLRGLGFGLVVVTNQSVIGRGWLTLAGLDAVHGRLASLLAAEGVELDGIFVCPHTAEDGCACRKPAAGLGLAAVDRFGFDPRHAFVVGDKAADVGLGRAIGACTLLVRCGHPQPAAVLDSADEVAEDLWCAVLAIERRLRDAMTRSPDSTTPQVGVASEMRARVIAHLGASADLKRRVSEELGDAIVSASRCIATAYSAGGKLLICGNGGSAADAQHMAAELVNGLSADHSGKAWPALALTTDTSVLTACANDTGFDYVFERQVQAFGRPGDVLLGISTSGRSKNVLAAAVAARAAGMHVIALTGAGGPLADGATVALRVPSTDTQLIQESHLAIEHLLCELTLALLDAPA